MIEKTEDAKQMREIEDIDEKASGADAEPSPSQEADEGASARPEDGKAASKRRRRIAIGAVVAAAVAACAIGAAIVAKPEEAPEPALEGGEAEQAAETAEDRKFGLAVMLEADGWTDASTKATVLIEATAPHGEAVPIEREIPCNEVVVMVEPEDYVKDAVYKVSVLEAPVLEDGSTYEAGEPFDVEAPSDYAESPDDAVRSTGLVFDGERTDATLVIEDASEGEALAIVVLTLKPVAAAEDSPEEPSPVGDEPASVGTAGAEDASRGGSPASGVGEDSGDGHSSQQPAPAPAPTPAPTPNPAPAPEPEPAPQQCPHNWMAEEESVAHEYCSICGAVVDGNAGPHLEGHAVRGEGVGSSYSKSTNVQTGRYFCPMCGAYK